MDIADQLLKGLKEKDNQTNITFSPQESDNKINYPQKTVPGVIVQKFMIEITTYPNGQTYSKIWAISKDIKDANKNKKQPKKDKLNQIKIIESEEI